MGFKGLARAQAANPRSWVNRFQASTPGRMVFGSSRPKTIKQRYEGGRGRGGLPRGISPPWLAISVAKTAGSRRAAVSPLHPPRASDPM